MENKASKQYIEYIYFGNAVDLLTDFLDNNKDISKVFFLVDTNTSEHCYPAIALNIAGDIAHDVIEVDAGEESKSIDICIGVWKMLQDFGADKKCLIVNLGGGVISDLGGFVASTYKRGVKFINMPTSLLGMIDAALGGKNGLDLDDAKNMIGTINQPEAIFIDTAFLETLPEKEIYCGFAEMLKHALIADSEYYNILKAVTMPVISTDLIVKSVEIKSDIITKDPLEKNIRKKLNFGHTAGHAIESYSLKYHQNPISHGEAVALGMLVELELSVKFAGLSRDKCSDVKNFIRSIYTILDFNDDELLEIIQLMYLDKKNENGQINFTLLTDIGASEINFYCEQDDILFGFKSMLS